MLAELFARVVGYVMGDFVAEDGGEAVFAAADGQDAAEDEYFAAVWLLERFNKRWYMYVLCSESRKEVPCKGYNNEVSMTYPGRTKAFFFALFPMTLTSHPSWPRPEAGINRSMTLCTTLESG